MNQGNNINVDLGRNKPIRDGSSGSILTSRGIVEEAVARQKQALLSSGSEINELLKVIDDLNNKVEKFDTTTRKAFEKNSYVKTMVKEAENLQSKLSKINTMYEEGNTSVEDLNKLHTDTLYSLIDTKDALADVTSLYDDQTGQLKEQNKALRDQSILRRNLSADIKKSHREQSLEIAKDIKEQQKNLTKANLKTIEGFANKMRGLFDTANLNKLAELSDKGSAANIQYRLQQSLGLNRSQFNQMKSSAIDNVDTAAYSSRDLLEAFDSMKDMNLTSKQIVEYLPSILRGQKLLGMSADSQAKLIALGNRTGRDQLTFTTNKMAQYMKHGNDLSLKSLNQLVELNTSLSSDMADLGIDSQAADASSLDAMQAMRDIFGQESGREKYYDQAMRSLAGNTAALSEMLGMDTSTFRDKANAGNNLFDMISSGDGRLGQLFQNMSNNYDEVVGDLDKYAQGIDQSMVQLVKSMVDANRMGKSLSGAAADNKALGYGDEAVKELEKQNKEAIGVFGRLSNTISNVLLKEADWMVVDQWRKNVLTSLLVIQGLLAAGNLKDLAGNLKGITSKLFTGGGGKGLAGKLPTGLTKLGGGLSLAAGLAWAGGNAISGFNNEEITGKDASLGSKLGAGVLSFFSGSKVHRNKKGEISADKNAGMGALSGAGEGALIGAGVGSFIPVVGTAVGAVAGGAIGSISGLVSGFGKGIKADKQEKIAEDQLKEQKRITKATEGSRSSLESLQQVRMSAAAIPRSSLGSPGGGGIGSPSSSSGYKRGDKLGHWSVTSPFGWRYAVENGVQSTTKTSHHNGLDFGGNAGNIIGAAAAGKVTYSGWLSGGGNSVMVQSDNGLSYRYYHMKDAPTLEVGQRVSAGDKLGIVGSTGNSTGPHLHFEVRRGGEAIEPTPYINDSIWKADGVDYSDLNSKLESDGKSSKNSLLQSLTNTYKVKLNNGGVGGPNDQVISGLSQINQTLLNLSSKQSEQEQILSMLQGKRLPDPRR